MPPDNNPLDLGKTHDGTDRDTDQRRDYYKYPDAIALFLRLGYDVTDNNDVLRLADDLRWAAGQRKYETEQKPRRVATAWSTLLIILGAVLTMVGTYITNKLQGKQ